MSDNPTHDDQPTETTTSAATTSAADTTEQATTDPAPTTAAAPDAPAGPTADTAADTAATTGAPGADTDHATAEDDPAATPPSPEPEGRRPSAHTPRSRRRRSTRTAATPRRPATPEAPPASAPGRVSATAHDRVWAALRSHPGSTPAELSTAAGVARSTVAKLLTAWAADGSVTSTPGGTGRAGRAPHRWTAAPSDLPPAPTPDPATGTDPHPGRDTDAATGPPPQGCDHDDEDHDDDADPGRRRATPLRSTPRRRGRFGCGAGQRRGPQPVRKLPAGRRRVAGHGAGLPDRTPRRPRPHRHRPSARPLVRRGRQRPRTARHRRLGGAHQRPTPPLPHHRPHRAPHCHDEPGTGRTGRRANPLVSRESSRSVRVAGRRPATHALTAGPATPPPPWPVPEARPDFPEV